MTLGGRLVSQKLPEGNKRKKEMNLKEDSTSDKYTDYLSYRPSINFGVISQSDSLLSLH